MIYNLLVFVSFSVESMGTNRFSRGKEFCAVQETGAARNNRSEGRDHSQKTIWLEGMDHGSTSP